MVARRLVLVHAGKPVARQRALDIVFGCKGSPPSRLMAASALINLTVKAEGTGRHRHPLGLRLGLVAHRLSEERQRSSKPRPAPRPG